MIWDFICFLKGCYLPVAINPVVVIPTSSSRPDHIRAWASHNLEWSCLMGRLQIVNWWSLAKWDNDIATSCLDAARYPAGSVRKAFGVCETEVDDDEEEFGDIFSIFGSLFGSMWPSMSPQAKQVEVWMRRRERIILIGSYKSQIRNRSLSSHSAEHRISHLRICSNFHRKHWADSLSERQLAQLGSLGPTEQLTEYL